MRINTKISFCNEKFKFSWKSVAIATVKNLLNMTISDTNLENTDAKRGNEKFLIHALQSIPNVALWNDCSKITYSHVHGSRVRKARLILENKGMPAA